MRIHWPRPTTRRDGCCSRTFCTVFAVRYYTVAEEVGFKENGITTFEKSFGIVYFLLFLTYCRSPPPRRRDKTKSKRKMKGRGPYTTKHVPVSGNNIVKLSTFLPSLTVANKIAGKPPRVVHWRMSLSEKGDVPVIFASNVNNEFLPSLDQSVVVGRCNMKYQRIATLYFLFLTSS